MDLPAALRQILPVMTPRYHFQLAIEAGCNAYARPSGLSGSRCGRFRRRISLILKVNDHDALTMSVIPISRYYFRG